MNVRMTELVIAGALAAALAAPALADTIYKSVLRDGSVVYGDKPVRGASKVERLDRAEPRISITRSAPAERADEQRRTAEVEQRILDRQIALDRAEAEVKAATIALENAEQRLQQSQEPLPGERTANASGGSRLNDFYQDRVFTLQNEVSAARRRLEAAYATRNSVRD
jgi:hypothetical protein